MADSWPSPSGGAGSDPPPPPPANPLVLVPGVCGTQLAVRREGELGDGTRCWVNVREGADAAYQKLWGKFNKESGRLQLLIPGYEVCVPRGDDDSGLFAISVLDPDVGFAVKAVHYYEPLISFLQTQGFTPGTNLFGAGYDYRQSSRINARALLDRLREVSQRCGGRRVDLFTHSMGGLVARSLLADFPAEFEALVSKWVAVGCPFGGAPGYAVDGLITGVQFGGSLGDFFFVQRGTFRQAAIQSPAVYELLPPLDFPFSQPPPLVTLWLKTPIQEQLPAAGLAGEEQAPPLRAFHTTYNLHSQQPQTASAAAPYGLGSSHPAAPQLPRISLAAPGSTSCDASKSGGNGSLDANAFKAQQYIFHHDALPGLLTRLLKDNTVSVKGASIPLPFDSELWALGQATHESWKAAKLPRSCSFYNIHGTGLSTPYDVQYGAWWYAVQDLDAVPHASATFTYVDGDATVPTESAISHGLQDTATLSIKGAHRDLVTMQEVWDQLLSWLREPAAAVHNGAFGSGKESRIRPHQQQAQVPQQQQDTWIEPSACQQQPLPSPASSTFQPKHQATPMIDDEFWNPLVWRAMLS